MACILAIETSAHVGAVALLHNASEASSPLAEAMVRDDPKLSAWLLPAIERVLQAAGRDSATLDGLAFGAGPGAFTGVRTACATAQALAWAWQKPLLTVDSLEALAQAALGAGVDDGDLTIALDARMGELYVASFHCANGLVQRITDTALMTVAQTNVHVAARHAEAPRVLGSGAKLLNAAWALPERLLHAAEAAWARGVAQLGNRLLAAGHHTAPTRAEPLYVRNQVAQTEAERRAARSVLPANAAQIVAISA